MRREGRKGVGWKRKGNKREIEKKWEENGTGVGGKRWRIGGEEVKKREGRVRKNKEKTCARLHIWKIFSNFAAVLCYA